MNTGEYILNFFAKFIGTPAILIGLFALLGCVLQKKKATETISATIKTTIGFLIIGGGAGIISASISKLGNAFNLLFGTEGIVANNDVMPGLFLEALPNIVLSGSLIMISAMFLNILLARITQYKYIYLTGHVLFYLSVMFASVLHFAGLNVNTAEGMATVTITGALLTSIWMILSPAMLNSHVVKITNNDSIALAHSGSISYLSSAWIGSLVAKFSKKPIKSTEEIKFPKGLSFLRNTNVAIGITMFIVYLLVYFLAWGIHGYDALVTNNIIAKGDDVFVQGLLQAFSFAAGVEVLLIGVRMFIAEIVPSFQGISQKLVPNAKPALDCPSVFPYAPNAVLIGFISSFVGGIIAMAVTIGIVKAAGQPVGWAIVIPSIVPHFFVGATAGVFGNVRGGIKGAILGSFVNGLLISFVPFLFFGLNYIPINFGIGWGDSDFLLGLPFALLAQGVGRNVALWLLPLIALGLWAILPTINLYQKLNKKPQSLATPVTLQQTALASQQEAPLLTQATELKAIKLTEANKIVAVCGQGLGSSLLIEMNIKKVVEELKLNELEVTHTNINSFDSSDDKILVVICGADLADSINFDQKIILNNLLDSQELKNKIVEFLNHHK